MVPKLLGDFAQEAAPLRNSYPTRRELRELLLEFGPHQGAVQLLCRNRRRSRATERIKDEVALARRGEQSTPHEPQGLLGRMVALALLYFGDSREAPDGGDLGIRVRAVDEVVVESVTCSPLPLLAYRRVSWAWVRAS